MKIWQKIVSVVFAVAVVAVVWIIRCEQNMCCLCTSFRYHAPCLIDLATGEILVLDLYFPHETQTAELACLQPQVSTFSLVRLGNIVGTKQTSSKTIEISIPASEKIENVVLCRKCRKEIDDPPAIRYILADLYGIEEKTLIPVEPGLSMILRCYEISVKETEEGIWNIVIQGILE